MPENKKLLYILCDIALVINVSRSIDADAPTSGEDKRTGLLVLDLVKHVCCTIMSTIITEDRLAIVTFSDGSKALQLLTEMTDANKKTAKAKIEAMGLESCINLWHGLRDGIKLIKNKANTELGSSLLLDNYLPENHCKIITHICLIIFVLISSSISAL